MYPDQNLTQADQQELAEQLEEREVIDALGKRDEASFSWLMGRYQDSLLRRAMLYVHDHAIAEEIVQETWLGVVQGIRRFEGRSSLRTWIFKILSNIARKQWERESRSIPFSMLDNPECPGDEPLVDSERSLPSDHPDWPGHRAVPPNAWNLSPEGHLLT